jgi:UDP-N-acetylmuramate: L-alanyl-gamma-D-glutamyl-meso-diaminopimelate ligase
MHIHILGIAGTFMGGLAILGRELNYKVTGSDLAIYPPMSTQLMDLGIELTEGYDNTELTPMPDCVVVGNVMRRGMPIIEALLNKGVPLISGPEFLANYILPKRHVLAVSGTHGKTTTSSMLAWILDVAGLSPGFLIGGIPLNFGVSARIGNMPYFVVEADEYDSAFFDKRSKFIHYRPRTLIINNIEFDHADIFPNLAAIEQQFHHLVRTVPGNGLIVHPSNDIAVDRVLKMGCWSEIQAFDAVQASGWHAKCLNPEGSRFEVYFDKELRGQVEWSLVGQHNVSNALAAIIAAEHVGVRSEFSTQALSRFASVKRRLEVKAELPNITIYDDFAHHPTAIATTLAGLRAKVGNQSPVIAVIEIRSNTMRMGHHQQELTASLKDASEVYILKAPEIAWNLDQVFQAAHKPGGVYTEISPLVAALKKRLTQTTHLAVSSNAHSTENHVVFMSNGGFGGIHKLIVDALQTVEAV